VQRVPHKQTTVVKLCTTHTVQNSNGYQYGFL